MWLSPAPTEIMPTDEKVKLARALGLQHCSFDYWIYFIVLGVLRYQLVSQECGIDRSPLS